MPVVAVLPSNPPGTGGFGNSNSSTSAIQISSLRLNDEMSVADIKAKTRELVVKETRNASALTLIRTARTQSQSAKEQAARGELKTAFASYLKAAILVKTVLESQEYNQEAKKGGVIRREINDFMENDGKEVLVQAKELEEKLKAMENAQAGDQGDSKGSSVGKSIADRMRALEDNGLSLGPTKLRENPSLPTPPVSPRTGPPPTQYSPMIPPTTIASSISGQSTHTLVSPSSFGPPSPTSTPPSSPPKTTLSDDISSFNQNFPSIEDLDGSPAFFLPSVPTGSISKPIPKDLKNGEAAPSPAALFRNYAIQIERPSSTPITPINNFLNRPPSPSRASKPSGLYNGIHGANAAPRVSIPNKNTALPQELRSYIRAHSVLLIDVRNRVDFDREHIKSDAVVCVEAPLLSREGVTADALEEAMVVAPRTEASLFGNRDKFDLVVVYDQSSTSFGSTNSPLSIIVRVIREQAFKKILKRPPMMLVGGLDAWKKDVGDAEVIKGTPELELQRPIPTRNVPPAMLPSTSKNSNNPFTNGSFTSMATQQNTGSQQPHALWTPKQTRPDPLDAPFSSDHRPTFSVDYAAHSRSPADAVYGGTHPPNGDLTRRPAMARGNSSSISFSRSNNESITSPSFPTSSLSNPPINSPISYPQFPRRISPTASGSNNPYAFSSQNQFDIASPPPASLNPALSRKRSDYVDQSEPLVGSGFNAHVPQVGYPDLTPSAIIRPPPVAAPTLERQDIRPRVQPFSPTYNTSADAKLRASTYDWPARYWGDEQIGVSGLKNLGNTCYMNAPIQCLSATLPFARFFTEHRWRNAINYQNPMGSQGRLTGAFAKLVHEMWGGDMPYLTPVEFRRSICQLNPQYNGSDQHDSQEFLSFLIDGIHEDLNRIVSKPPHNPTPEEEAELERLPPQVASDKEWRAWRARNDSLIVDYFQGQFRSRLQCLTCHKTSTTYNVFSILQLPIPYSKSSKVSIDKCLETLLNEEVLDKDDAWDCPQCKCKRRALKKLSLARLPPVLMIHFKRFEANGRFQDKIDTFVEYPLKNLDLTNYMPPALPPGVDKSQLNGGVSMSLDDPRTQQPPYRYDLYGVTNHFGNLSSGHYTAYIASSGGWRLCDDSSVKSADPKQVVNQKAYVLFYKRVRS
ncbi:hypothetical protein CVT24_008420 [Panaeolus cyanescens]|uniref:ubiquitinyl hydrolase 1 n=1 Tax=Panaeolus cyanescens TaxID=181874 RepID=A0A409VBI0_9AGAR|nr:hypothetical protein CVT24_008420 [Panaeolus cyanescens]